MAKIRMADIAKRMGISTVSVSKALAGKDGVSEELRTRILKTAREMGYELHHGTVPSDSGYNLGVIVADRYFREHTFYYKLYTALLKGCQKRGSSLMMEIISPASEENCSLPVLLSAQKVQGLILMGEFSEEYCKLLMNQEIPILFLDFYKPNLNVECVLSDNLRGGELLTEHLLKNGKTKIAFVGSVFSTSSIMDRCAGYCKALLRAGIRLKPEWRIEDRDKDGLFIPIELPKEMPEAFVCNCDAVAFQVVKAVEEAGYQVPRDICVTGYDDFRYAEICKPPLTSYRIDVEAMSEAALELLIQKMEHKPLLAPTVTLRGSIILRESTCNEYR